MKKNINSLPFKTTFYHGLRWNGLESVLYYTIFMIHQLALRAVVDTQLYGIIGSLFALIYLTITVTNFGFDLTLAPFYQMFTKNKKLFNSYVVTQLILEFVIYSATGLVFFIFLRSWFLPIKAYGIPFSLIISSLIITEGIKKSLRIILQTAFLTHKTATAELFYIVSYVTIVWAYYSLYKTISLYTLFVPMIGLSLVTTLFLAISIYNLYRVLPETDLFENRLSWQQIIFSRIKNYGYQLTKVFFTSNFLIPFFALTYGFSMAALLELVTAINQFVSIIIQKIFGITGQALFSLVKHKKQKEKQAAFNLAISKLYPILYAVLLISLVAYKPLFAYKTHVTSNTMFVAGLFFFILLFSENFTLLYEKWLIIEEKTVSLILINGMLIGLFYVITRIPYWNSPAIPLIVLISLRIIAYITLRWVSQQMWKQTNM